MMGTRDASSFLFMSPFAQQNKGFSREQGIVKEKI